MEIVGAGSYRVGGVILAEPNLMPCLSITNDQLGVKWNINRRSPRQVVAMSFDQRQHLLDGS
jgi:hypothetical protein